MSLNSLTEPVATGHTAEIYRWEEQTVLKLFRNRYQRREVEHEARMARTVHNTGLPTPAVIGEIVEIDSRYGIVYERVNGVSMLNTLTSRPWLVRKLARLLAELQATIHGMLGVPGLPSQHEKLSKKIHETDLLPADLRAVVLRLLAELPEGNRLCHGDFHPDNVLLTPAGATLIDWIDVTIGNPLGDVARSALLMNHGQPPEDTRYRWVLNQFRSWFTHTYLSHYRQLCPGGEETLVPWRIVNAAARLSEGIPEAQALLAFVKAEIEAR